ncbi:sensor domain-containing diguanylate cyclase [Pseudothermotoga sp.]|uniref:sensor domain-containing diguanylate cyclase n=1 Tax=Pseudothermotoga sp. TaxID=2033661 RepID=UPI0031F668B9
MLKSVGSINVRRLLAFLIIFSAVLSLLILLNLRYARTYLERSSETFKGFVELLANAISARYFHSDTTYKLVSLPGTNAERLFSDIAEEFPVVEKVHLEENEAEKFAPYRIEGGKENLFIKLVIYNNDTTDYVIDKIAVVQLNVQRILQLLNLDHIVITSRGFPFAFGMNAKATIPLIDPLSIVASLSIAAIILMYRRIREYKIKIELDHKKKLERKTLILESLNDITREMLMGASESAYQLILKKAVECVPNAQAGSLLVRKDSVFHYIATVGFDLSRLSNVVMLEKEISQWVQQHDYLIRRRPYEIDEKILDQERLKTLVEGGGLKQIKSTLVVPVRIEGQVEILFNLDNFESEDAFNEEDVQVVTLFANHIGLLLKRLKLEEQLEQQYKLIEHISYHDALTRLPNRRFLEEFGEKMLSLARRENKNLVILFIDLVDFKLVNDNYGHETGDEVLKIVAERMSNAVRSSDFIARLGGDEFILILYDCDTKGAMDVVKRLIDVVEKPISIKGSQLRVGATIGVAEYPKDGETLDALIRKADVAMYLAKRKGIDVATTDELSC